MIAFIKRFFAVSMVALILSGCNPRLVIPGLFNEPFVYGGQEEVDAGHVVDVTGWCFEYGFYGQHFVGHYSTHGSIFGKLPENLQVGDRVTSMDDTGVTQYVVTEVGQLSYCSDMWGDAVLQTSAGPGVMVWHLSLITDL